MHDTTVFEIIVFPPLSPKSAFKAKDYWKPKTTLSVNSNPQSKHPKHPKAQCTRIKSRLKYNQEHIHRKNTKIIRTRKIRLKVSKYKNQS